MHGVRVETSAIIILPNDVQMVGVGKFFIRLVAGRLPLPSSKAKLGWLSLRRLEDVLRLIMFYSGLGAERAVPLSINNTQSFVNV